MFRSRISKELHEAEEYYLVDYDFKGAHGQKPHPQYDEFYKMFKETFGVDIAKFRSTASVISMATFEDALKVKMLVEKCGGVAHVRKTVTVQW